MKKMFLIFSLGLMVVVTGTTQCLLDRIADTVEQTVEGVTDTVGGAGRAGVGIITLDRERTDEGLRQMGTGVTEVGTAPVTFFTRERVVEDYEEPYRNRESIVFTESNTEVENDNDMDGNNVENDVEEVEE